MGLIWFFCHKICFKFWLYAFLYWNNQEGLGQTGISTGLQSIPVNSWRLQHGQADFLHCSWASGAQPTWEPVVQARGLAEDPVRMLFWVCQTRVESRFHTFYFCPSDPRAPSGALLQSEGPGPRESSRVWVRHWHSGIATWGCNKQPVPEFLHLWAGGDNNPHLLGGCVTSGSSVR